MPDFDEGQHPRDANGRFVDVGAFIRPNFSSGEVYQVTKIISDGGPGAALMGAGRGGVIARKVGLSREPTVFFNAGSFKQVAAPVKSQQVSNWREIAKKNDFPEDRIKLDPSKATFELNGKTYVEGGHYSHDGTITIRSENPDPGIMAHEMMHAKYDVVTEAYGLEKHEAADHDWNATHATLGARDAQNTPGSDVLRAASGEPLHQDDNAHIKDEYASRYPTAYSLQDHMLGSYDKDGNWVDATKALAREDGVSAYSKDYWDAYAKGTGSIMSAVNETLAEMARYKAETGRSRPPNMQRPHFRALFRAVNKEYARLSKMYRGESGMSIHTAKDQ